MSTGLFEDEEDGYNLEEETKYKLKLGAPKSEPAFGVSNDEETLDAFADAGDDGGFGSEGEGSDKPFDDTPFDAGVEADEDTDPEKFIQQLAGKLGTSLRKYNDERGQPDFDLEKYAINSVISATHTSEMDEEDQKDIIRKIKMSGAADKNDEVDKDLNIDEPSEELDSEEEMNDDMSGEKNLDEGLEYGDNNFLNESDRCTRIAKSKYDVWPSAYASGAVVRCRQGKIWKNLKEENLKMIEGYKEMTDEEIDEAARKTDFSKEKEDGLHGWFSRRGGEGSQGWVDCNTCRDGKCKPCGRKEGETRAKYPSCRPTPAACKAKGKGESWGKKSEEKSNNESLSVFENEDYSSLSKKFFKLEKKLEQLQLSKEPVHPSIISKLESELDELSYKMAKASAEEEGGIIKEDGDESNNYMFWQNLNTIKNSIEDLMSMDKSKVDELLSNGHGWALDHLATSADDIEEVYHFIDANTDSEGVEDAYYGSVESINEAEYKGKEVKLNKPMRGDVKKYKVYVKNDKGNVVKVNFGDKNMEIKRDDPERRKSFRARHKCETPGPKWKARYWSCKFWSTKSVSDLLGENLQNSENSSNFEKNNNMKDIIKTKLHEMNYSDLNVFETLPTPVKPEVKPAVEPISPRRKRIWETKPSVKPKPKMEEDSDDLTF